MSERTVPGCRCGSMNNFSWEPTTRLLEITTACLVPIRNMLFERVGLCGGGPAPQTPHRKTMDGDRTVAIHQVGWLPSPA